MLKVGNHENHLQPEQRTRLGGLARHIPCTAVIEAALSVAPHWAQESGTDPRNLNTTH